MMRIAVTDLRAAQQILLAHGFSKQHERIFSRDEIEGGRGVQCLFGFDDSDAEGQYEVSVRCLERPVGKGKKGADIERVRVINVADAPEPLRQAVEAALSELERLAL
jgi:hypothetical protein